MVHFKLPLVATFMLAGLSCQVLGASGLPEPQSAKPPPPPVSQAMDLQPDDVDATSVRLHWPPLAGATEYEVSRDGKIVGRTVSRLGYFSDFGLRPGSLYRYSVTAYSASGSVLTGSQPLLIKTTRSTAIKTQFKVLAIAFNPDNAPIYTEETYLKHRIEFLKLASQGNANISLYKGGILSTTARPAVYPGSTWANYEDLVTRRDLGLNGNSIVDLIEKGDIDHVWVVKAPVDFGENALIGNRKIQGAGAVTGNTWVPIPVKSSRSFFVNAYSPDERSYDAYAHMVEGVITSISDGHPDLWPHKQTYTVFTTDRLSNTTVQAQLNDWERFRIADGWNGTSTTAFASTGNGNVGSSHFPPTSGRECADYCYFDHTTWQRYIDSVADDWATFPQRSGVKRKLNGYDFGAFNNYVEGDTSYSNEFGVSPELHPSFVHSAASFHQWWFAHLPHNPGIAQGKLNSWWPYIYDFNRFDGTLVDYGVSGFVRQATHFNPVHGEYGTDVRSAKNWGYWNSQNGFSPGGKSATLSVVDRHDAPQYVRAGRSAIKVRIENAQYWDAQWGVGRNDVFYPATRNAKWNLLNLARIKFSVKPDANQALLVGSNPIVRLYKNGGNRIEFVPKVGGRYANLLSANSKADASGWFDFSIPVAGDASWEKNVIGYIDPAQDVNAMAAARAKLESDILADVNYVEISIRSTTSTHDAPHDVMTYYIDGLTLQGRFDAAKPAGANAPGPLGDQDEDE
jgi:hypothetical protein